MSDDEDKSPGQTRKFPNGKLTTGDEGVLGVGVKHTNRGDVIVHFGKSVAWIGMGPAQAEALARNILRHAMLARAKAH